MLKLEKWNKFIFNLYEYHVDFFNLDDSNLKGTQVDQALQNNQMLHFGKN